jgi:hypothetical protein
MPLSVKLQACLWLLGFRGGDAIEWDHDPALALRAVRDDGSLDPPANDPRYIVPRSRTAHREKTSGTAATSAGSDIHLIAKIKRIQKKEEEFRRRLLGKAEGTPIVLPRASIRSRGFNKTTQRRFGEILKPRS